MLSYINVSEVLHDKTATEVRVAGERPSSGHSGLLWLLHRGSPGPPPRSVQSCAVHPVLTVQSRGSENTAVEPSQPYTDTVGWKLTDKLPTKKPQGRPWRGTLATPQRRGHRRRSPGTLRGHSVSSAHLTQISAHPRKGRYSLASSEQRTEEFQPTVIGQLMMNAIHYATLIDWALDTMHRQ